VLLLAPLENAGTFSVVDYAFVPSYITKDSLMELDKFARIYAGMSK
jgi:hypothetical protein